MKYELVSKRNNYLVVPSEIGDRTVVMENKDNISILHYDMHKTRWRFLIVSDQGFGTGDMYTGNGNEKKHDLIKQMAALEGTTLFVFDTLSEALLYISEYCYKETRKK